MKWKIHKGNGVKVEMSSIFKNCIFYLALRPTLIIFVLIK